jgi:hypothetical protein
MNAMLNKIIIASLLSAINLFFIKAVWSDVILDFPLSFEKTIAAITISGIIKNEDVNQFKEYASQYRISSISLNSEGGSVDAAISIGRHIRQLKYNNPVGTPFVWVNSGQKCISSCVLILAGGLLRSVSGTVGIHRPFLIEDSNYSPEQQKKIYARIEKSIKDYLEEVNVPVSLYDTMFRIPTTQIRYLTTRELQDLNLNENDPYFQEANQANAAKKLNMSKINYLKYRAESEEKCDKEIFENPKALDAWEECTRILKDKYSND